MNWNQIETGWEHLKGSMQHQWAKLTDDDLEHGSGGNGTAGPGDGAGIPGEGESDQSDDSGKPAPNPMPDDLDEPAYAGNQPTPHQEKSLDQT